MVWFQCEDCGESLKKGKLSRHSRFCTATKLSCIDCGNMFGQDSVQYHNQCLTEAEKYGPKKPSNGYNLKQQQLDYDINADLFNSPSSLCKANMTCEQDYISHDYGTNHREKAKEVDFDINVGLSNHYPWLCSLCNIKATSQQNLLSHANGKKHQANVKWFDANQQQQQPKHSTVDKKDNSRQQTEVDIYVGLSSRHPWFCSLCNTKATSQQNLLSHANGRKHRENVELFDAKQQQHLEKSTVDDKKDKIENAPDGVANGYSQADKKRKLETFNETWNGDVVQTEEAKGRSEEKSESKKAKKQDDEKKEKTDKTQTKSESDFEYDKEDIKLLLVSYSKEELVNLIYKTAEKGSRLISAILESADRDIAQRNIFVRGFGWDTTHENLRAAFESYGEIEECSVVMDKNTGRGKGYGFVLFKTRKGAREALKNPEKRMYNRIVVCNLASEKPCRDGKVQDMVEPVKTDLTKMANQSEATFTGLELSHGHVLENRHQQQTMDMYRQNIPFYEHSQLPGFDPMYGALSGNQMVAGLPNYGMFGSGLVNQGSMLPPQNHMGMAGQYFGDGGHAWYQR